MVKEKLCLLFVSVNVFLQIPFIFTENVENENEFTFKDFMKKYSSATVKENINKARRAGINITKEQENIIMVDNIDATDEIFGFDIKSLPIAKTAIPQRRWGTNRTYPILADSYIPTGLLDPNDTRGTTPPPQGYLDMGLKLGIGILQWTGLMGKDKEPPRNLRDPFNARIRLFALMQQVIYQAREKMTIMQKLRRMHKDNQLYKMGFLFSKTDQAAKTFSIFFLNAYKQCNAKHFGEVNNMRMFEMAEVQERLENLWFDVDLLSELIVHNDKKCKEMIDKTESDRRSKIWFDEYEDKMDWTTTNNPNFTTPVDVKLGGGTHSYWGKK